MAFSARKVTKQKENGSRVLSDVYMSLRIRGRVAMGVSWNKDRGAIVEKEWSNNQVLKERRRVYESTGRWMFAGTDWQ